MPRRSFLTRFVSWLALAALLLRMAVPMLAVGAAHWRGVAVGEVCTVYGVVLAAASDDSAHAGHAHHHSDRHGPGSDEAHTGDHCALTALAQLGVFHAPLLGAAAEGRQTAAGQVRSARPAWGDASATWVARRKQGPPPPLA